jgi:hypothetical protein
VTKREALWAAIGARDAARGADRIAACVDLDGAIDALIAEAVEAALKVERAKGERTAPVQPSRGIPFPTEVPWRFHERAWSQYAAAGHGRQSAERMAERGGFGVVELVTCLLGRDYNRIGYPDFVLSPEDIAKVRDEIEGAAPTLSALTEAEVRGYAKGIEAAAAEVQRVCTTCLGEGAVGEDEACEDCDGAGYPTKADCLRAIRSLDPTTIVTAKEERHGSALSPRRPAVGKPTKGLRFLEWSGPLERRDWEVIDLVVRQGPLSVFTQMTNEATMECARAIPHCETDAERWELLEEAAHIATMHTWAAHRSRQ